jgi:sugar phosphate isomerase/epimerase
MRFRHRDGTAVHLAYCTNVHPAEDGDAFLAQVGDFGAAVRARLGADRLGLGLWLPAPLAARLARDPAELARLRATLERHRLEVVTLNAFPYRGFHAPVVKKAVYRPDWTGDERLAYTLDCAEVLAALLPDDAARGSVSTVPLAWRDPWDDTRRAAARDRLRRLADGLAALGDRTGRTVRVGLEPEPGCAVETTAEAVAELGGPGALGDRIGICLDACHLAVAFEDPGRAVARLAAAGLPVVKSQVSAALHAADPADPAARAALARYTEDRFLHQVREDGPGGVAARDDLPAALTGPGALPGRGPWRVHFHVPLHRPPAAPLTATTGHLRHTLDALLGGDAPLTDHLEVETYTWSVLPPGQRPGNDAELAAGLAGELRWAADALAGAGLRPDGPAAPAEPQAQEEVRA